METIFDVLNFLHKLEVAFYLLSEDHEKLNRGKEILTNLFQDQNSEKLESVLKSLREIDFLSRAADWHEIPDVVKILCEKVKGLSKEYKIKILQNEI